MCSVISIPTSLRAVHRSMDWYETEAGLDLRVLDDDSAELRAAANAIDEVLWLQRMQVTEIAAAWTGFGADCATRFLQRHCDAAAEVAAHVRAAAEGYAALRDNLWRMVDRKAATAVAIDDRRVGERSAWLAAAHTVTAGAGDRSAAEQLVRQHVIPYVDNDIRDDWLTAMRSTTASVEASYDAAIDTLSSVRNACFEIPGELGPRWQPVFDEPPGPSPAAATVSETSTPADIAPTVPAAASAPAPVPPAPPAQRGPLTMLRCLRTWPLRWAIPPAYPPAQAIWAALAGSPAVSAVSSARSSTASAVCWVRWLTGSPILRGPKIRCWTIPWMSTIHSGDDDRRRR